VKCAVISPSMAGAKQCGDTDLSWFRPQGRTSSRLRLCAVLQCTVVPVEGGYKLGGRGGKASKSLLVGVGRKPETRTPNPKNPTPNPKNPRPENPNVISGVISRNPKLLRVNRVSIHGNRNSRITRILRHPLAAHVCAQYFSPAQQH
jgi:hypothetical protein